MHPFLLNKLGEDDIVSVTPYRDQHGRRMMIYKFGNWRPSKIPLDDIFKASLILLEMGAMEPQSQVLGGVGEFLLSIFEFLNANQKLFLSSFFFSKNSLIWILCESI